MNRSQSDLPGQVCVLAGTTADATFFAAAFQLSRSEIVLYALVGLATGWLLIHLITHAKGGTVSRNRLFVYVRLLLGSACMAIGIASIGFAAVAGFTALDIGSSTRGLEELDVIQLTQMVFLSLGLPFLGFAFLAYPGKTRMTVRAVRAGLAVLTVLTLALILDGSRDDGLAKWVVQPDYLFYEHYVCHHEWEDTERANFSKRVCRQLHPTATIVQLIRWGGKFPYDPNK